MNAEEFDHILTETLDDYRLSRSEKKVLTSLLDPSSMDDQELAFYRSRVFDIARHEVPGPQAFAVLKWVEDVMKALQPKSEKSDAINSEAYFSPSDDCVTKITGLLRSARREIDICVFTITDNRISKAIEDAHQRNIKVRIITDDDKSNDLGSDVDRLSQSGIPVRFDRTSYHMHHKYAIFDSGKLLTGSYNWTRSAATSNEENFIITDDRKLVSNFNKQFESLWKSLE